MVIYRLYTDYLLSAHRRANKKPSIVISDLLAYLQERAIAICSLLNPGAPSNNPLPMLDRYRLGRWDSEPPQSHHY